MDNFLLRLFVLFLCYTRSFAVDISLSSNSVCRGQVTRWTCITNGTNILTWRHSSISTSFTSSSSVGDVRNFGGSFTATLTNICGSQYISTASVNVSSALNGTTLDCFDRVFGTPGINTNSTDIIVKDTSPISSFFIGTQPGSDSTIYASWSGAECVQRYEGAVINSAGITVFSDSFSLSEYSYSYKLTDEDTYTFTVTAYDYFGVRVEPLMVREYNYRKYNFTVEAISSVDEDCTNPTLYIAVKIDHVTNIPPMTSCVVYVSSFQPRFCNDSLRFPVTLGETYTYTVNITNIVGTTPMSDIIPIPNPQYCSPDPSPSSVNCPSPTECPPPTDTQCSPVCPIRCSIVWIIICCVFILSTAVLLIIIFGYFIWMKCFNKGQYKDNSNQVASGNTSNTAGKGDTMEMEKK